MNDDIKIISVIEGELSHLPEFYFKRNKFSFLENVCIKKDNKNCYKYKIEKPYTLLYMLNGMEKKVVVKKNFLCDGNSGWFDTGVDWIFHDWLYATHGEQDELQGIPDEERKIIADKLLCKVQKFYNRNCLVQLLHRRFFRCSWISLDEKAWTESGNRNAEFFID